METILNNPKVFAACVGLVAIVVSLLIVSLFHFFETLLGDLDDE